MLSKQNNFLDFSYENNFWSNGQKIVVGLDEVGRGPLAGPVVIGAVALTFDSKLVLGVRDSKKVTKNKHSQLASQIKESCHSFAVGVGSVEEINSVGIVGAIRLAISRALSEISQYDQVLMDGLPFKEELEIASPIEYIVKGDSKAYSIAAASIIAKEYRDNLMNQLGLEYPHYDWQSNAGYGTKAHREAIKEHGVCQHHRSLFVRNLI